MNLNAINHVRGNVFAKNDKSDEVKLQPEKTATETKTACNGSSWKSYFEGASRVSFGFHCTTGEFQVKKLQDVPCCCCGKLMLRGQDQTVCQEALAKSSGSKLAANIEKYGKYMRADEKALGTMIAATAKETGGDLSAAMRRIGPKLNNLTKQYATGILTELNTLSTDAFATRKNPVSDLIQQAQQEMKNKNNLDRCKFVEDLDKATASLPKEKQALIQDTAMNLPQSFNHVRSIHDKYENRSNKEIARRLFSTALTTAEHIHPHSLGGPDDTDNYIAECAGCNNPRGSMDYADWLKVHPEYPRKAQEHIEHVQARLINGEISRMYNSYPIKVRATLSDESGGRMVLKVLNPSTIEKMREQRETTGDVTVEDVKIAYEEQEGEKE